MDIYSSGEDVIIKTRKPYTITKQREKWTEEEHNKFLEALKLYGRAWQRIEEHIGTKTAVQIRSHAQKFFSKLEKESLTKGVPLGQAHGIEIPPPRPKRKPNNPYPRKTFVGVVSSSGEGKNDRPLIPRSSLCSKKKVFEMEVDAPHEKHAGNQTLGRTKGTSEDSKCSVALSLFQDAPCAFIPPASKGPADACIFREFVPLVKENIDKTADGEYSPTVKGNKERDNADIEIGRFEGLSIDAQMKLAQETSAGLKQPQNVGASPRNDSRGNKSYPEHIPAYSIDGQSNRSVQTMGSGATCLTSLSNQAGSDANPNVDKIHSATTEHHTSTSMSSVHQSFTAPPFTQFCSSQDAYRSFLNMSSTFSSLIMSTLLQNPTGHAAASLAASLWPAADVETSTGSTSETFVGGIPVRHMNAPPSMAAIAAATVAAASAWWATHGLLPFCPPAFHSGFVFAPASASTIPRAGTAQATEDNKQRKDEVTQSQTWKDQRTVGPELSAPGTQSSPLSSDSDESGAHGRSQNIIEIGPTVKQANPMPDSGLDESDKLRSKKKVDRSSCGSNTPSSSELETETVLENLERGKEETKEVHLSHPSSGDTSNRRVRGGSNVSESWKEVSQEGRLAFQALFSRGVLPQSFSPPHAKDGTTEKAKEKEVAALSVDLNSKVSAATYNDHAQGVNKNCSTPKGSRVDQGLLTNEIGQVKLKSRRTGFKPYKRCSMEAKESRAAPVEEKDKKRIRLGGSDSWTVNYVCAFHSM